MSSLFTPDDVTWVKIPFREDFRDVMLAEPSPRKTQTARYDKMAEVGDCFEAFGATFTVIGVYRRPLWRVAVAYIAEGFNTQEEFRAVWEEIHPKRGYRPLDMLWVHGFRRNGGDR